MQADLHDASADHLLSYPADTVAPYASPSPQPCQLHCQAVALRVGEMFGEFGVEPCSTASGAAGSLGSHAALLQGSSDPLGVVDDALKASFTTKDGVTRWHLFVAVMPLFSEGAGVGAGPSSSDGGARGGRPATSVADPTAGMGQDDIVFNETMDMMKPRKMVKLEPSRTYRVMVRLFSKRTAEWGAWSDPIYATTLNVVTTSLVSIGEDFVKVQWDRPPCLPAFSSGGRQETCEPRNMAASKREADIANFELQIVRERTVTTAFCEQFESGVHCHTVRNLMPGTAYIALVRYENTLASMTVWREVARFYTEAPLVLRLTSRGDNVYSIAWRRGELPLGGARAAEAQALVGYQLPQTHIHLYEVFQESLEVPSAPPVQVQASAAIESGEDDAEYSYVAEGLFPSTRVKVYVRAMSIERNWGCRSNVLDVRTADIPEVHLVASGETFLSFQWSRAHEEGVESKVEYCVQSLSSEYRQQKTLDVSPSTTGRVFHVEGLNAESDFAVSVRTFLDSVWGSWSEAKHFSTLPRGILTIISRSEDSLTIGWPSSAVRALSKQSRSADDTAVKVHVVVTPKALPEYGEDAELEAVVDQVIECDPALPGFRIGGLQLDTVYIVKYRTWEVNALTGYEDWGEFTTPVEARTLRPVPLQVQDLGEDFAEVTWSRGLTSAASAASSTAAELERYALKYELLVRLAKPTKEDNDGVEGEPLLHRQVVDSAFTITNLKPATSYVVSVRACDENMQWGAWSAVRMRTLAPIATSIHEIGEDYARLMWQRIPCPDEDADLENTQANGTALRGLPKGTAAVAVAEGYTSKYSVFVYSRELLGSEVEPDPISGYPAGGRADVTRREMISGDHTALRVDGLLPDREYVAVVRAATASGSWGLWSRPVHFRTTAQFCIPPDNLSIGENYVSIMWTRETQIPTAYPSASANEAEAAPTVQLGDSTVTGQQLRVRGLNSPFAKDQTLAADVRELKVYGLSPASAYCIQLRVQGRSGMWGLWSPPVNFLTRGTIVTRALEVAEDYAVLSWQRSKVENPSRFPTGRGVVTSYHLRVHNHTGVHTETFLADSDCPYRITGLLPDTYYCVELKANYNDEEWGLWSSPLWCLTMQPMTVSTKMISEQFCRLSVLRPNQQRRLPEDDGNRPSEDEVVVFGELRPSIMLCVTTPALAKTPHTSSGYAKPKYHNSSLPPTAADHRLIYQTELVSSTKETEHTISNLKSNTVYSVAVRAKLSNGEWGLWSQPLWFATVPTTCVTFTDIGESFIRVDWKRHPQVIPPQVKNPEKVCLGLGTISASRVRVRDVGGESYQHTYQQESSATSVQVDGLSPSTTYAVSVQTFNDNYDWGVWSEEGKVRTVPGMNINIQHASEDSLWVSWARLTQLEGAPCDTDTAINVNIAARAYHVRIVGPGGFHYNKEMDTNKLFFRGLLPDTVYRVQVRTQFTETGEWGLWSSKLFRTRPRLRVTFGSIGEHFAMLEWRRHLPRLNNTDASLLAPMDDHFTGDSTAGPVAKSTSVAPPIVDECEDVVLQYRFKVLRVGDPTPMVFDLMPTVSSFHLSDLRPSSEYRVWVCAKGYEGVWGFWSKEGRVRTLPKLQLSVDNIGEDYVNVNWRRGAWEGKTVESMEAAKRQQEQPQEKLNGELAQLARNEVDDDDDDDDDDDRVEVRQVDGAASGYQVRVLDRDGNVLTTKTTSWRETSCVLTGLSAATLYSVEVSAKDTYNEWGLWSDAKWLLTLHAVDIYALQVGETFIDVEWARMGSGAGDANHDSASKAHRGSRGSFAIDNFAGSGGDQGEGIFSLQRDSSSSVNSADGDDEDDDDGSRKRKGAATAHDSLVMPAETIHEDETPTQWHVRVNCKRIYAGLPFSSETKEFFCDAGETWRRVDQLVPNATYMVSVRAKNRVGEWGHWSTPLSVNTYPLLHVEAESTGETFVNIHWGRPEHDQADDDLICFPRQDDVHNFQVSIRPAANELPFDEEDEPLVDGARVYETTQPTFRVGCLLPGIGYVVVVREQMIDEDGKAIPGLWGALSEPRKVETTPPLSILLAEIGEDYCLVEWRRVLRKVVAGADDDDDDDDGTGNKLGDGGSDVVPHARQGGANVRPPSPLKSKEFELHTVRLNDDGCTVYHGALSLDSTEVLPPSTQSFHVGSLIHNTIYAVRVRAKTASGSWGPWSTATRFVTQGRLQLTVQSVYEESLYVSWTRPLPEWASSLHSRRPHSSSYVSSSLVNQSVKAGPSRVGEGKDGSGAAEERVESPASRVVSDGEEGPPLTGGGASQEVPDDTAESAYAGIVFGEYSVQQYEITVGGISCELESRIAMGPDQASACVTSLCQNHLYWVSVRSLSENGHWSVSSTKQSVLTLNPVEASVKYLTESTSVLRWSRTPATLEPFLELLERARGEADKACDERERRDLFELKRRVQEMENRGEKVSGWLDQATRKEHNALLRQEAVRYLLAENIVLGDDSSNGYRLMLASNDAGSVCSPYVVDSRLVCLRPPRVYSANARHQQQELADSVLLSVALQLQAQQGGQRLLEETMDTCENEARPEGEAVLVDVLVHGRVEELTVSGLRPSSSFHFAVCARNVRDEWLPWSVKKEIRTLAPITLGLSRFGEHYISLYWHRMNPEKTAAMEADTQRCAALQARHGNVTRADFLEKRGSMSSEGYAELVQDLRELGECRRRLQQTKQELADGKVELITDPNTPLQGFLVRVVQESGDIIEHYVHCDELTSSNAGANALSSAFTATGLQPNNMYVCLLCADYGHDIWGKWTEPLKFMTQNLIQLDVTFMSEAFVDIEWHRMPNKRLPLTDRHDTILSERFYAEEQAYQLRIEHDDPATGTTTEELRDMRACNVFRVDRLLPDTKYTIAVREWDAKGDWGLWCAPRTCVTLPATFTTVEDAGEDFVTVSWGRYHKRVDYENDMHVMQAGVDTTGYYLRVVELPCEPGTANETEESEERDRSSNAEAQAGDGLPSSSATATHGHGANQDDVSGEEERADAGCSTSDGPHAESASQTVFSDDDASRLECTTRTSTNLVNLEEVFAGPVAPQRQGPLPSYPAPELAEGEQDDGRVLVVRKFDPTVTNASLRACLRPDRVYCVQVAAENAGSQLGAWSEARYCRTLPRIVLSVTCIDEQFVDLSWRRPCTSPVPKLAPAEPGSPTSASSAAAMSHHPELDELPSSAVDIFLPSYETQFYELEVVGAGLNVSEELAAGQVSFRVTRLQMNTVYTARVRSINTKSQISVWSAALNVATLCPMSIVPSQITETVINVEWGRPAQQQQELLSATSLPAGTAPVQLGSREAEAYQVRVQRVVLPTEGGDGAITLAPVVNKVFAGSVQTLEVDCLTMNTAYVVSARARNRGNSEEWSQWSEGRCVYTMKALKLSVAAVGEDFVRVSWERASPDEVMTVDSNGEAIPSRTYPLVDTPATATSVYASVFTQVKSFSLSVVGNGAKRGASASATSQSPPGAANATDAQEYTMEVDGSVNFFTVPSLSPNTVYYVTVRANYSGTSAVTGPWSEPVQSSTYNMLALELKDLGEDFFSVAWQRLSNSADLHKVQMGKIEETLCYELALYDCTTEDDPATNAVSAASSHVGSPAPSAYHASESSAGPLDSGASGAPQATMFTQPKQRHCRAADLLPNHRYRVCVRRWYEPLPGSITEGDTSVAAIAAAQTDDARLSESMQRAHAQPGAWSTSEFVVTLRSMVCFAESIGEDFFSVRWERDPCAPSLPTRKNFTLTKPVQAYEVRIDQLTSDGTAVDRGNNTYHTCETMNALASTRMAATSMSAPVAIVDNTFTAQHLRPSGLYKVEVRSCIDKVWGQWSAPAYVMTLPKLDVVVRSISEDCAVVAWERQFSAVVLPDGSQAAMGDEDSSDRYQLELAGVGFAFRFHKKLKGNKSSYMVKHLEPDAIYAVRVRSADSARQSWSLWSESVFFVTLAPIQVNLGPPGEQFVHLSWNRAPQVEEDYRERLANASSPAFAAVADAAEGTAETGEQGRPSTAAPGHGEQSTERASVAPPAITLGDPEVIAYHLCVFNTQQTPSQAVIDKQFRKNITSFRAGSLLPDTSYVVIVRACNASSQWGLWSEERSLHTLKLLQLHVDHVGESYLDLKWERESGDRGAAFGSRAQEPVYYQLALKCEGQGVIERSFGPEDCQPPPSTGKNGGSADGNKDPTDGSVLPSYRLKGLRPATAYSVALQPRYGRPWDRAAAGEDEADAERDDGSGPTGGDWGLWTRPTAFVTLSSLQVAGASSLSPRTIEVSWNRRPAAPLAVGFTESVAAGGGGAAEDSSAPSAFVAAAAVGGAHASNSLLPGSMPEAFAGGSISALSAMAGPSAMRAHPHTVRRYQLLACCAKDALLLLPPMDDGNAEVGADVDMRLSLTGGHARIPDQADDGSGGLLSQLRAKWRLSTGKDMDNAFTASTTSATLTANAPDTEATAAIPDMDASATATTTAEVRSSVVESERAVSKPRGPFFVEKEFDVDALEAEWKANGKDINFKTAGSREKMRYLLSGLSMDTAYVVRVRAQDMNGEWGPWAQTEVYTPPQPPMNVVLRKVNAQYCSLQWMPPPVVDLMADGAGQTRASVSTAEDSRSGATGSASRRRSTAPGEAAQTFDMERRVYRYVVEQYYASAGEAAATGSTSAGRAGHGAAAPASSAAATAAATSTANANAAVAVAVAVADWQVVDVVEDTVCPVRIAGPVSRLRCRVKCIRVATAPIASERRSTTGLSAASTEGGLWRRRSTGGSASGVDGLSPLPYSDYCDLVSLSSGTPPEAVRQLLVSSLARSSASLEWSAPPKPPDGVRFTRSLYRVYASSPGRPASLVGTAHRPLYTLNDLLPSTTYTVQVVAENADGMSYHNPCIRFTTKAENDTSVAQHDPTGAPLGDITDPSAPASAAAGGRRAGQEDDGTVDVPTARGFNRKGPGAATGARGAAGRSPEGRDRASSVERPPSRIVLVKPTKPAGAKTGGRKRSTGGRKKSKTRSSSSTTTAKDARAATAPVVKKAAAEDAPLSMSTPAAAAPAPAAPAEKTPSRPRAGPVAGTQDGGSRSKSGRNSSGDIERLEAADGVRLPRLSRTL